MQNKFLIKSQKEELQVLKRGILTARIARVKSRYSAPDPYAITPALKKSWQVTT